MFIHIFVKKKEGGHFSQANGLLLPPYLPLSLNKWGACISGFGFNPKEVIVNHKNQPTVRDTGAIWLTNHIVVDETSWQVMNISEAAAN